MNETPRENDLLGKRLVRLLTRYNREEMYRSVRGGIDVGEQLRDKGLSVQCAPE